jgi:hypothetical protein
MLSLLARPDRLWQLRQLLTSPDQRFAARKEWQSLVKTLEDTVGWDYDADVRPWLGQEATFAVTSVDLDHDDANGRQAGYLAVLGCRDAQKARQSLHLLWQKRIVPGRNLVFETVSGVPLIYDQPATATASGDSVSGSGTPKEGATQTLASAVVGDRYVLLGSSPKVLRQAISTYRAPDVSLAKMSRYQDSVKALPSNRVGWLYADVPNLLTWLGLEDSDELSLSQSGRRANYLFMSFRALASGVLGDTAIAPPPGTVLQAKSSVIADNWPNKALALLPPESLFVNTGTNLPQFISTLHENIGGYAVAQRSLKTLLNSLPFSPDAISAELIAQLQGPYAIAALMEPEPTWLLVAEAANAPFSSVDALIQEQGGTVSHADLEGRDVTIWTRLALLQQTSDGTIDLATQVLGVHTNLDGCEVLSTSLVGLQQVFQGRDGFSLSEQPTFVQMLESLNASQGTLAYVNWPALAPLAYKQLPWLRAIEQGGQPITRHIGPVLTSGRGGDGSLQEGTVVIKLLENL